MHLFGFLPPLVVRLLFGGYWIVLMTLIHYPIDVQERGDPTSSDKLVHVFGYGLLAWLAAMVVDSFSRGRSVFAGAHGWKWAVVLIAAVTLHGLVDEFTQPLTNRDCDPWDAAADVLGATLAVCIYVRLVRSAHFTAHGAA